MLMDHRPFNLLLYAALGLLHGLGDMMVLFS